MLAKALAHESGACAVDREPQRLGLAVAEHDPERPRIVVDTSAIIDGRIAEVVESGFIFGTLVIPRFVLDELQHIADSSDTLRRNRGRRGLEILSRMQKEPGTPVEIIEDDVPEIAEVDAKLVALAKARGGQLNYGSNGPTSFNNLAAVVVMEGLGIKMQEITYRGDAQQLTDLMSGTLDVISVGGSSSLAALRADGRYDKLSEAIRERDLAFAGSVNPMLARHGEMSEARQYSGRQVDPAWQCPFHALGGRAA